MKKLSALFAAAAMLVTGAASMGCVFGILDEPKAPKKLVD